MRKTFRKRYNSETLREECFKIRVDQMIREAADIILSSFTEMISLGTKFMKGEKHDTEM